MQATCLPDIFAWTRSKDLQKQQQQPQQKWVASNCKTTAKVGPFTDMAKCHKFFPAYVATKTTELNQKPISGLALHLIFHRFSPFNCCLGVAL